MGLEELVWCLPLKWRTKKFGKFLKSKDKEFSKWQILSTSKCFFGNFCEFFCNLQFFLILKDTKKWQEYMLKVWMELFRKILTNLQNFSQNLIKFRRNSKLFKIFFWNFPKFSKFFHQNFLSPKTYRVALHLMTLSITWRYRLQSDYKESRFKPFRIESRCQPHRPLV